MGGDSISETFLNWYRKLWKTTGGDSGDAVERAEQRLGVKFPALLRDVYLNTSLRSSQMLHLSKLKDVEVEDDVVVFAREQQACWSWGIPVARLAEANPRLVANPGGRWEDDDCTLDDFLRFFALTNRPYEPPFIDQSSYEQTQLDGDWTLHEVRWKSLQHALWTNGEAVLEDGIGNLGARDADALRRAATSLEIDDDEVDEALEQVRVTIQ